MNYDYDFLFKIVLIGDAGVGKTSLLRRFTDDVFTSDGPTIGVDFSIKTLEIDSKTVKLQVWDTAGQERFRTITQSYYRSAQAIVVVYDVTNRASFASVPTWIGEVEQYACDGVRKTLVGNKSDRVDVQRVVSRADGRAVADRYDMTFVETSARTSTNVVVAFEELTRELCKKHKEDGGLKQYVLAGPRWGTSQPVNTTTTKSCCI